MAPGRAARLALAALGAAAAAAEAPFQPVPDIARRGEGGFDELAERYGDTMEGMSSALQSNPLQFPTLTDFWCFWELTDRKRLPALLIDDMQVEYEPYVRGILPQTKLLLETFRKASLPVFWSTWWRWGPHDGFFNAMDRFYGPVGWRTSANALYNHNLTHGGDVLEVIAPKTDQERRRVMHKSYSLDMFDERPMAWLVTDGQGTLHSELQRLGVDTVVQVGAWTDDCIISTAFHAFSLQYDVVLVEDGVSTASKQHFNAIEVIRGAAAKVLMAADVAAYIDGGLPVRPRGRVGSGAAAAHGGGSAAPAPAPAAMAPAAAAPSAAAPSATAPAATALAAKAPAATVVPEAVAPSPSLATVAALSLVGPLSFMAGWSLRGRTQEASRGVPFVAMA